MSNKDLLTLAKTTIIVAFDLLFFILKGFDNSVTTWIALIMLNLIYLTVVLSPVFIPQLKTELSALSYSFYRIEFIYFIVVAVSSLLMMVLQTSLKVVISVYILFVVALVIIFVFTIISNNDTTEKDRTQLANKKMIISFSQDIKFLERMTDDIKMLSLIKRAQEVAQYSDKYSSSESAKIEEEIQKLLTSMKTQTEEISEKNINLLLHLLEDRNEVLKSNY